MTSGRRDGSRADDVEQTEPAPEGDLGDLAAELRGVLLVSSRILRSHTASDEISTSQYSVLAYLLRTGEATPGELADFEHVTPPVMTRILARLEKQALVHRRAHPGDGRQRKVTLTEAGERIVRAGRRERDSWLRTQIGEISGQERETLREASAILRRSLMETGRRSRPDQDGPSGSE